MEIVLGTLIRKYIKTAQVKRQPLQNKWQQKQTEWNRIRREHHNTELQVREHVFGQKEKRELH